MRKDLIRLLLPFIILHIIIICGLIGFMVIEDFTFAEAFYMTTITITTTGFDEVRPLSPSGRLFTTILLIFSWAAFALVLTRITQYIISGEINAFFKTRKLMSALSKLSGHVVICGFGRNGQQAAHTLKVHGQPFVVIEQDEEVIQDELSEHPDLIYLIGDGTDDDVLLRAGIQKARALITTLPEDADNVFIVLSARDLNPKIQVISRASHNSSVLKLKKAGADSVIMPDRIGGTHMATLVSKPDVIEFIDYLSGEEGESISMESVAYEQLPRDLRDRSLQEIMHWKRTGVNCIGIKTTDGKFVINPPEQILIKRGMKVIVLGTRQQIEEMKENIGE
ncbi:MAG TPA: potassium channel protein [Chitinophagaceae bacterium]|nr:potassium channel protein [Chitinophagaceae bacterium]